MQQRRQKQSNQISDRAFDYDKWFMAMVTDKVMAMAHTYTLTRRHADTHTHI